jgi:hypothetical protein
LSNNDALFEAAQGVAGSDSQMRQISDAMIEESNLQGQLDTHEAIAADISRQLNDLRTRRLPELMMAAGVERFGCIETGTEAKLAFECSGALGTDEAERERKIDLLIANGADEIVKLEVKVPYGKGKYGEATQLAAELADRGLVVSVERNIHHQTLKSWIKERMEKGASIPLDELGLWYGQTAKIKRPKTD